MGEAVREEEKKKMVDPWVEYAVQQARFVNKTVQASLHSAINVTTSRLVPFFSTASAHLNQTIDTVQEVKCEYHVYEDLAFAKIKDGILIAVSHPVATCAATLALGFVALNSKLPFYTSDKMMILVKKLFVTALLSRAESKVHSLRQSIEALKAESQKLEKSALQAEDEMTRGRTKLRQAGKQIQGVIRAASKIERQAGGLKDMLGELPRREASRFRSQVSNLASEAKKERNALAKEVSKISNYGISV